MNEFENYMEIRESVSDLIHKIEQIESDEEKIENIDYAIKMLKKLKEEVL